MGMEANQGRPMRLPFHLPARPATQHAIPVLWECAMSTHPILHNSDNKYQVGIEEKKVYPTIPAA